MFYTAVLIKNYISALFAAGPGSAGRKQNFLPLLDGLGFGERLNGLGHQPVLRPRDGVRGVGLLPRRV
jgi:hypothetical protein